MPTSNNGNTLDLARINEHFHDDETARDFFEKLRWPDGPVCPHCGEINNARDVYKRQGYVGLLPMSPINATSGNIAGGMIDSNDNGRANSYSSVTGTYKLNANGSWGMTLTFGSGPTTLDFDFYVSSGSTQSQTKPGDLTLYAISTDPVDSTHPALSGSMAYQVPMSSGYTNASFNGTSVSALTGANANVSLTVGQTDGTSGGTGGTGGLTGSFDQNNNGTIISAAAFPGGSQTTNPYTYVATSSAGRYIFYLLGNPTGSSPVNPIPFVLYASGANRGFLLDQNSSSVITGAMYPQPTLKNFSYTFTELPGVFAAATLSNSDPSIAPVVQNLLVTSPGAVSYTHLDVYKRQVNGQAATLLAPHRFSSEVLAVAQFDRHY